MAGIEKRIANNGKETFRVKVRKKGYPVQTATFKRKTDVKKWAQQVESAIDDDFSSSETIGTQTGDRVGLIQYDGVIYRFTEPGWPGAYKSTEKKLGVNIKFGGVVDIGGHTKIEDFPEELRNKLFTVLTKGQKEKVESSSV